MLQLKGLDKQSKQQAKQKHQEYRSLLKNKNIVANIIQQHFEKEYLLNPNKEKLNELELEVFFLGIQNFKY